MSNNFSSRLLRYVLTTVSLFFGLKNILKHWIVSDVKSELTLRSSGIPSFKKAIHRFTSKQARIFPKCQFIEKTKS